MKTIVWFRQDLRCADNPALAHAAERGTVVAVYILEETGGRPLGGASRWWLHNSLMSLEKSLGHLVLLRGDPAVLLPDLARAVGADAVVWNRRYEPASIATDTATKAALKAARIEAESFNGALLFEPWQVRTKTGGPYKVFTPFWRACHQLPVPALVPAPAVDLADIGDPGETLDGWDLLPKAPDWAGGIASEWTPGEAGAQARLARFLEAGLRGYRVLRDRPDKQNVSRLSPHLHFGEVSPRQVRAAALHRAEAEPAAQSDVDKFLAELGWREFSHHLLYHFKDIVTSNLNPSFDGYPWDDAPDLVAAWQRGRTGYPLVDAGMRELWATGYVHNRVRMVVASFLIKHLKTHWKTGEAWFWDTLVDADLANNVASWQWVAGSGADAAPYFRIFNPTTQAQKFDPQGDYIRRWCPELADLPTKYLHAPDTAPGDVLAAAGVRLGETYPHPIVDHRAARAAALAGYEAIRNAPRTDD